MNYNFHMREGKYVSAQRLRIIIAAVAAIVVLGIIISLYLYASSLRAINPITPYSSRFESTTLRIDAGAGVFRERNYYVSTSDELATPSNGQLIVNPIQVAPDENTVPLVQRSIYSIDNTIQNNIYTRLTNSKRSEERKGQAPAASLISLDFRNTLTSGSWESVMVYNNNNPEELVDSTLIFAPASLDTALNWQNNFSLFLIDGGATEHSAAILPGVNILNDADSQGRASGAIFSNRPLTIGGLPSATQASEALDALSVAKSRGEIDSPGILDLDISQRITGTDILFSAPEGRRVISNIQAPNSTSGFGNTLTIEDGVIAIDKGVTLVVGTGNIGNTNSLIGNSETSSPDEIMLEGSLNISPRSIIVDGGTLILSDTEKNKLIINSDIQVRNGGSLQIGNDVVINGNIYVFGKSSIEVLGSFVLNGKAIPTNAGASVASNADVQPLVSQATGRAPGGIYIFANNTLQADGTPLGSGSFKAGVLWMIDGKDGIDPIIHSRAVHFLSAEAPAGYPLMYNEYSCYGAERPSYICSHLGPPEGVVAPEIRVGFSEDMAEIVLLIPKEKG